MARNTSEIWNWRANGKPPYVPTAEEKLASLDVEYQQKFDEINNAIIIAVTEGDTELQQELVAEKAALKEEYNHEKR